MVGASPADHSVPCPPPGAATHRRGTLRSAVCVDFGMHMYKRIVSTQHAVRRPRDGRSTDLPTQRRRPNGVPGRSMASVLIGILCTFILSTASMPTQATAEPAYHVVRTLPDIEVREYADYVVAEVWVPGPADEAGKQAFPILAGYIFGKNKGDRKLAMTAPVTQSPTPTKLEMTAPVTQSASAAGFLVQFVLPQNVSLATAPEPLDARIHLREVALGRVAVIRFSGFWSQSNYDEHLAALQTAMRSAGLASQGEPVYARYNPPFLPWFLRRNEIWLRLAETP